jgi:antirestriction protein
MSDQAEVTVNAVTDTPSTVDSSDPVETETAGEQTTEDAEPTEAAAVEEAPKPKPNTDKLAALARKEKQLRDRMQAAKVAQQKEQEDFQSQVAAFKQQAAELEKYRSELNSLVGELKENPIEFLKNRFNIGPEEYYNRIQNNGAPTKDEVLSEQLQKTRQEIEELRQWRNQREEHEKKAAEEAKHNAEMQAARAQYETAQNEFWGLIEKGEQYPNLAVYDRDVVLAQAQNVVKGLGSKAANMTYAEIADIMEEGMRNHHTYIVQKLGSKAPAAVQEAVAAETTATPAEVDTDDDFIPKVRVKPPVVEKEVVRSGPVSSKTLNKTMAVRTSGKTEESPEDYKKRVIAELNAAPGERR